MTGLPSFGLAGKVAVVTGVSRGPGRAMALAYLASDAAAFPTGSMITLDGGRA
jgi:NAD(P)-dependent dehydrogenase (short-subunit alcohol dehydrogenase family)